MNSANWLVDPLAFGMTTECAPQRRCECDQTYRCRISQRAPGKSGAKSKFLLRLPHQHCLTLSSDCSVEKEEAVDVIRNLLPSAEDKGPAESFPGPGSSLSFFDARYSRTLTRYTLSNVQLKRQTLVYQIAAVRISRNKQYKRDLVRL